MRLATQIRTTQNAPMCRSALFARGPVILVDPDPWRCRETLDAAQTHGASEVTAFARLGEAVDTLRAARLACSSLFLWSVSGEEADLERLADLRQGSPDCRLIVFADVYPSWFHRPERLLGACQVEHNLDFATMAHLGEFDDLAGEDCSMREILTSNRVPMPTCKAWAWQIYGAPPGAPINHAAMN